MRFRRDGLLEPTHEPVHRRFEIHRRTGTFHVQRCASWRLTGWRPLLLRQSAGIERRPSPPGLVRVRLLSEPDLALPAFHRELYLWDIGQGLVGKPLHRKHHRSHDRREKGRHETRNGLPPPNNRSARSCASVSPDGASHTPCRSTGTKSTVRPTRDIPSSRNGKPAT